MIYTTDNTGEKIVKNMTVEKIRSLSNKYPDTNKMIWLVRSTRGVSCSKRESWDI